MSEFPQDVIDGAKASQVTFPSVPASISLAQWALESSWGNRMPPDSNNPFGIKAKEGQPSVTIPTHEFIHGRYVLVQAAFAKFASLGDAFTAHARLLATETPYGGFRAATSLQSKCDALTGVYATDPQYGEKLMAIINSHHLEQYDAD